MPDGSVRRYDKSFGESLNETSVIVALDNYLGGLGGGPGADRRRRSVASRLLAEAERVAELFRRQTGRQFFGTSLLFLYDAAAAGGGGEDGPGTEDAVNGNPTAAAGAGRPRVRLIDFANVYPAEAGRVDANCLAGVESVVELFKRFIEQI